MIKTICLNPAIDKVYYVDDFKAGNAYFNTEPETIIGGKGINVHKVLQQLGAVEELYCFLGGCIGDIIKKSLKHAKVFNAQGETRTTINIIDRVNGTETEIKEKGTFVSKQEVNNFLYTLEEDLDDNDLIICSGSIGKGFGDDIYQKICHIALSKHSKCALDTNAKDAHKAPYFFLKPNEKELAQMFDLDIELTEDEITRLGKELVYSGIQNLLVTRGEKGAIFINQRECYKVTVPEIEIKSTIGSGDATVAGFCFGYSSNLPIKECLRLAMACGMSNAMVGKIGVVDLKEIENLKKRIIIERA